MKAQYIEHSSGPRSAIGVVVVNENPVPAARLEEDVFTDSVFKVTERPKPQAVS